MVRVISVHHFTKQDVTGLDRVGGNGATSGKGDILFVGGEHKINIRDLNDGGQLTGSFATVDQVQQLIYCKAGNFICTLETKPARHGGTHTYVRVYLHYDQEGSNLPMRARIAGRVTPSSQSGSTSNLEMVEIPLRKPAVFISCCQTTGNIAVASGMNVSIFKYNLKTHDISKQKFIDFDEMLELDISFVVKEVTLSEDLIGCVSDTEAHVFQLTINSQLLKANSEERDEDPAKEDPTRACQKWSRSTSRSPGRSTSSSQFKGRRITVKEETTSTVRDSDDYFDLGNMVWVPTLSYGQSRTNDDSRFLLFPSLVGSSQCGQVEEIGETMGPINSSKCSDVRVKLVGNDNTGHKYALGIFDTVTLIHRRVASVSDPDLPFSNLKVVSVYESSNAQTSRTRRASNVFLPLSGQHRVGASIFMTTPHVGHLYHVTLDSEPFNNTVVRGGVFSYTAPVDSVALEPSLLHALTLTGLETYTLRPHPHIVTSHVPDGLGMIVPPHWEESVCLVGLRPFLNVESLTLTDTCLALIATNDEGVNKSHTLYSLHLPNPGSLYKEMVRVGKSHRAASPSTYLHLLLEAHFVLTTALHHDPQSLADKEDDLVTLMQDSSALLGDYYAACTTESEWDQAVQYYRASGLSPDEIVERDAGECKGLIHVLVATLLYPRATTLTDAQVHCVLDYMEKMAPDQVSTVVLQSPSFKIYKIDKVMAILKGELSKTTEPQPKDALCLALMILERGFFEQVSTVLSLLKQHHLVEVLLQHSDLLLKKGGAIQLSGLSQVLVEHKQEVFIETFVCLIGEGTLSLDAFVDAFVAVYPIVSCGPECNVNSLRLRSFLESFFMEYAQCKEISEMKDKYSRAATALVSLYLASLMGAFNNEDSEEVVCNEQRASVIDLYAERPAYLNRLPPFNGNAPAKSCKRGNKGDPDAESTDLDCTCTLCCLHLLLLQSLLTSDIPAAEDRANVLKFVGSNQNVSGSDSLRLLSLDRDKQLPFLLEKYPDTVLQYCKDTYTSPDDWKEGVATLFHFKSSVSESDAAYQTYTTVLDGILEEVIKRCSFEIVLNIIPKSQHQEVKWHLLQCHSIALALHLKQAFVKYADNVLINMIK